MSPALHSAPNERRHDLDALRAFAMLLGIALHAAIPYAPGFPWALRDSQSSELFALLFMAIHGFRMPLFFLISGFFTVMVWRQKGMRALLRQRFTRILLPCLLGCVTILPAMTWIGNAVAEPPAPPVQTTGPITTVIDAIRRNDLEKLAELTSDVTAANDVDRDFQVKPLAWAAMHGNSAAVRLLLERGADVNGRNGDGSTALHGAAFTGNPQIVRLLLDKGGDPLAANQRGELPSTAAVADAGATLFVWQLLQLPAREPQEVIDGRLQCLELLPAAPSQTETAADTKPASAGVDIVAALRSAYSGFLTAEIWNVPALSRQGQPPFHLFFSPVFDHLWFLWFLCWIAGGFAVLVPMVSLLKRKLPFSGHRLARILTVSPARILFLVPTVALMTLMGLFGPSFGPDTSVGLLPQPHVLLYYSLFFAYGCLYYLAADHDERPGRWWWLCLAVSLGLLLPLHFAVQSSKLSAVAVEAAYAWLMSFGCLGIFRRFVRQPNVGIRWLSDASYWLYLTHLPVLFLIQAPLRSFAVSPWLKFAFACSVCVAVLLVVYQYAVRYTWLGTLLNGPRRRQNRVVDN